MVPRDGRPITYILPTTAWASLLDVIVREAPAGAVIATYTEAMRALSEQALARVGRADVVVDLRPSPEPGPSASMLPKAPASTRLDLPLLLCKVRIIGIGFRIHCHAGDAPAELAQRDKDQATGS